MGLSLSIGKPDQEGCTYGLQSVGHNMRAVPTVRVTYKKSIHCHILYNEIILMSIPSEMKTQCSENVT